MSDPPITRTALRYYGGKARIAGWVIDQFPPHNCYVEPFGGAASVLLRKRPARYEVYNDLNCEVVTFFRVLREQPAALLARLEATPFARVEHQAAYEPPADDVDLARQVYVRSWQTMHGANELRTIGWRYEKAAGTTTRTAVAQFHDTSGLWAVADRFKAVQIECDDACAVIRRFDAPGTLFYCDPPYPLESRGARWRSEGYRHELADADHRRLAAVLHEVRGAVVLSGYPCALYDELFGDWPRVEKRTIKNSHADAVEVLWLNPAAAQSRRQMALPLDLAGAGAVGDVADEAAGE